MMTVLSFVSKVLKKRHQGSEMSVNVIEKKTVEINDRQMSKFDGTSIVDG